MKYVLKNANLLDGRLDENGKMPVASGAAVVVDGDTVTAVYKNGEALPEDCEVIDLGGKYLLPGLINVHVHLAASGKPPKANAKPVNYKALFDLLSGIPVAMKVFMQMEKGLAKKHLLSGTTTIRTVGGVMDHDAVIRDAVVSGKMLGPRMIVCNTAVSVPGGHFAGSLATEAENPDMAREHVENIAKTNPDWIKLMITGGVMDSTAEGAPGAVKMSPEMVKAACDKAHELGYKVAAHVECPEGVQIALENGVDTVEHGAAPDEKILELFKNRGAAVVCTISPALPYVYLPEEISHCGDVGRKNGKVVVDGIIECAKKCLENGVTVGLGTDAGCNFITPYDMWRELHYFVKYAGATPDFALHTATAINAAILGLENEIGSIEAGKKADLIVCDKNPLESFENLRVLDKVIIGGKIIDRPKIKKRRDVETALNSLL